MCIYDLVKNEARLFKYGSGTGTNFSAIRGKQEKLSGGGTRAPGLMSFLEVLRPRRGRDQERRHHAARGQDGLPRHGPPGDRRLHQLEDARGEEGARAHRRAATRPTSTARPTTRSAGQNSNNSVRVTDDVHARASTTGGEWQTIAAHDGRGRTRRSRRKDLWHQIADAAWALRRSRACSTTRPSTAGTPARTRAHQRVEPVLRVHVPRRLGLQPVEREPDQVPPRGRLVRRRGLPPRRAASSSSRRRSSSTSRVPDAEDRARTRTTTARSASATRTSARC